MSHIFTKFSVRLTGHINIVKNTEVRLIFKVNNVIFPLFLANQFPFLQRSCDINHLISLFLGKRIE